jgi:hypothetical protein
MNVLAIVGQMRSGTSAVAEVVHTLGCPVAVHTPAPLPPTYRFDWEDSELSNALAKGKMSKPWLVDYLHSRDKHSKLFPSGWFAIKSPLLALHWYEIDEALDEVGVGDTCVVRVWRNPQEVERSMRLQPQLSVETNTEIRDAMTVMAGDLDMAISYETLLSTPLAMTRGLAKEMGIKDEERIMEAAARVRRPQTKEERWPQSQLP